MANISVVLEAQDDLTVFTVEGDLTAEEILHYSSEYYDGKPTKLVLWDITGGSVGKITNDEFKQIASHMKDHTSKRQGGKTAFVAPYDLDFGLSRMYEFFAELEDLPVSYRTFRNVEGAREWLLSVR